MTKMLPGPPPVPDEAERLRRELRGLETELREARKAEVDAKQSAADAIQAIANLRDLLEPFHTALKMIFGEISRVDAEAVSGARPRSANGHDPRWEGWKSKLGGRAAEFIDLLLEHGEMNTKQFAAAARCDPRTVAITVYALNSADLINKNGGRFSLKPLP